MVEIKPIMVESGLHTKITVYCKLRKIKIQDFIECLLKDKFNDFQEFNKNYEVFKEF